MSIPNIIRTGICVGCPHENMYTETFLIIYHVLAAILRRSGFKDCLTYLEHNSLMFDQQILDSGILFNLFSEYGVGKSLEPLIYELFSTNGLDPEINKYNVFFQEIIRLTKEVSNIIRSHDSEMEGIWLSNYSTNMVNTIDPISLERDYRLSDLFYNDSDSYDMDSDDSEYENDSCECAFCDEFRNYYNPDLECDINRIINEVLTNISQEINKRTYN